MLPKLKESICFFHGTLDINGIYFLSIIEALFSIVKI